MAETPDDATRYDSTPPSDADLPEGDPSRLGRTRASEPEQGVRRRARRQQWREEFPYHRNADDLITRRDTLRFLVAGSGALFVATAALAITGAVRANPTYPAVAVARLDEVPENAVRVFAYPDQYSQGLLINLPGKGLVAYSDACTHLSCAVLYQPENRRLFCPCHDGLFDAYTGNVLAGPPTRPLPVIELQVRGDVIYAVREVER
jgi:Rieske Fe-S protein